MKRKFLKAALFAAIVMAAGWNISQSEKEAKLSDVALENVEALTGGEGTNSDCDDVCLDERGNGCWCYQWYSYKKEAEWR